MEERKGGKVREKMRKRGKCRGRRSVTEGGMEERDGGGNLIVKEEEKGNT